MVEKFGVGKIERMTVRTIVPKELADQGVTARDLEARHRDKRDEHRSNGGYRFRIKKAVNTDKKSFNLCAMKDRTIDTGGKRERCMQPLNVTLCGTYHPENATLRGI
jgi:hypothetical protein